MKKLLALALIVAMLICIFTACNKADSEDKKSTEKSTNATNSSNEPNSSNTSNETTSNSSTNDSGETTQKNTENNTSNSSPDNTPENNEENVPENNDLNNISAEEWKAAFDFSTLESFTMETSAVNEHETFKATNVAYDGYIYAASGADRHIYEVSSYDITAIDETGWLSELIYEIEDLSDYGYSKFTYSKSDDLYTAKIDVDVPDCDVTVKFENKRISKITIDVYGTMNDEPYVYDFDLTYTFSNYNSSTAPEDAKYLVTSDQWKAAFELSNLNYYKYTSTYIDSHYTDVISVEYDSALEEYTVITNDESSSRTGVPEGFGEMGSYGFFISEFVNDYSENSYGFYNFCYSDLKYTANVAIDDVPVDAEIFFLNGKIDKIVLSGEDFSQTLTISYEK